MTRDALLRMAGRGALFGMARREGRAPQNDDAGRGCAMTVMGGGPSFASSAVMGTGGGRLPAFLTESEPLLQYREATCRTHIRGFVVNLPALF